MPAHQLDIPIDVYSHVMLCVAFSVLNGRTSVA
jgi:hypothetical protein